MSDNWVVQNLENALETWNEKLAEIWQLITTSPQNFKLVFHSTNTYYELMKPNIEQKQKEAIKAND